ncbi:pilus assembly protein TadG-related protein [Streptomyces sp. NPDC054933]
MSLFYAVALVGIFMILGLVVDGGGRLQAGARADSLAQEAARAGGQQIDPTQAIPGNAIVVDPAAAQRAAESYLHQAGVQGEVAVSGDGKNLSVTVHTSYHTIFASLLGYSSMPVAGHGTATLRTQAGG